MTQDNSDAKTEILSDDDTEVDEKKFEFQAKKVCLTYSQALNLTTMRILEKSKEWGAVKYVIGEEFHQDGGNHYHVYLTFAKRVHSRDPKVFDIDGYHPNIKKVKRDQGWIEYCMKDGHFISGGIELFKNSTNFIKRKNDFDAWCAYVQNKQRDDVQWPIQLPDGSTLDKPTGKRRHYWVVGEPNRGKTEWIQNTFTNKRVYTRGKGNYPYDTYDGEPIIIFDDFFPKFDELSACSTVYRVRTRVYGDTRYRSVFWPLNQERIMFVLSNLEPNYGNLQEAFDSRFNVIKM